MVFTKLRQSLLDPMIISDKDIDEVIEHLNAVLLRVQHSPFRGTNLELQLRYHVDTLRAAKTTRHLITVVSRKE